MLVILKDNSTEFELLKFIDFLKESNIEYNLHKNNEKTYFEITSNYSEDFKDKIKSIAFVKNVIIKSLKYKLVSRDFKEDNTIIDLGNNLTIGDNTFIIIAGPCSVDDENVISETAHFLSELGINFIRGGAFKPRTSPYSFQGLGKKGLEYLKLYSNKYDLKVVTESISEETIEMVSYYSDIIQIGSRNSQNISLLKKIGYTEKPILLKRGFMNTIDEFLFSAEYIALSGNNNIILCERGIRTFETKTRNTLDISAFPIIKKLSHLPIIVDPSHASGRTDLIIPLTKASLAIGADGCIVEVHIDPSRSLSDDNQSLNFNEFTEFFKEIKNICNLFDKRII